jgi:uncharacterized repeat protein (TIGR03843 family)
LSAQERQKSDLLKPEVEQVLNEGKLELIGLLPYASNRTFLVRCCHETTELTAVYKPAAGERPLYDFPSASLCRREVAAYVVSRTLGWDLVPPTVLRADAPLGQGSVQAFVDHDPEAHYFTLLKDHEVACRRLALFDMLTNNADRKSGHVLLDRQGKIWAIDNGLTFHVAPKLRTVIWDFVGQPLGARDRSAVGRLVGPLAESGPELEELAKLLDSSEIATLRSRAEALARPGTYPSPTSDWAFPWPLV